MRHAIRLLLPLVLTAMALPAAVIAQTPTAPATPAAPKPKTLTLPATVAPYQQVTLVSRLSGYVKSISVDVGDRVRKGQTLAQIEAPELLADRAQYRAEAEVARANRDRLTKALASAPDLVSAEKVDEAKAQVQVAEAKLAGVETRLAFGAIVAPFAGVVTERKIDPGAFVQASSGNAGAVLTLMDFHRVRVQVRVAEKDAPTIKPGLPVLLTSSQLAGRKFEGKVTRVSYALDAASRMMLAEVELDNRDETLRPGMLMSATLTLPDAKQ